MNFFMHHVGMMSLLQHKVISSIIGNFRKHNKAILTLHFIHGSKEHNSFISPYINTIINNSLITKANYNTQTQ